MQTVSTEWLDTNEELMIGECYAEIEIELTSPETIYTVTVSAASELEILSDVTAIVSQNEVYKYGTLEKNLWLLDGSISWADESHGNAGYISDNLSDENGDFANAPVIKIVPSVSGESIYGITITWSELFEEYAKSFTVRCLNEGYVKSSIAVENNEQIVCPVQIQSESYDEIQIVISSWCLPYRRARVENILMGYKIRMGKSDFLEFHIEQNVSPLNATLPESILSFSIDCTGDNSVYADYFRREQKITSKVGMNVENKGKEMINGGTYYLDTWDFERDGLRGNFTAKSLIYFLDVLYPEGIYTESGVILYQLAVNVLEYALKNSKYTFTWKLTEHLKDISTTAPLPVCTCAECLQLIAQAAGCTLICGRNNEIKILKTSYSGTTQKYEVPETLMIDYPKLQLQTELSRISANVYSYSQKDSQTIYKAVHHVDGETEFLLKHEMSANVSGTVTAYLQSENIETVSENYFACYSRIKISGTGFALIEIKGNPLETNTSVYSADVSDTGSEETISNQLITDINMAKRVCEAAVSWLQNRNQETVTYRADPRLDAGDFAVCKNEEVLVSELKYDFTGMFRGSFTGRIGYEEFTLPDESESGLLNDEIWPDVNGDGKADAIDAALIQTAAANIAAGLPSGLTDAQVVMADANRDGRIRVTDAALVSEFATSVGVGMYSQSPSEWVRFLKNKNIVQ